MIKEIPVKGFLTPYRMAKAIVYKTAEIAPSGILSYLGDELNIECFNKSIATTEMIPTAPAVIPSKNAARNSFRTNLSNNLCPKIVKVNKTWCKHSYRNQYGSCKRFS